MRASSPLTSSTIPTPRDPSKDETIGTKALFPGFIEPVLAEQVDRVPRGERWIHEVKFDGYHCEPRRQDLHAAWPRLDPPLPVKQRRCAP